MIEFRVRTLPGGQTQHIPKEIRSLNDAKVAQVQQDAFTSTNQMFSELLPHLQNLDQAAQKLDGVAGVDLASARDIIVAVGNEGLIAGQKVDLESEYRGQDCTNVGLIGERSTRLKIDDLAISIDRRQDWGSSNRSTFRLEDRGREIVITQEDPNNMVGRYYPNAQQMNNPAWSDSVAHTYYVSAGCQEDVQHFWNLLCPHSQT